MRRKQTQIIGDVLCEFFKQNRVLDVRLNESRLIEAWEEVLGSAVGKYTKYKYVRNKVLYVSLTSAVLRSELSMTRERLVKSLNERVGMEVITDISFR